MRKSKKGQLKMEQSETSTQYINPTNPTTDPPPKENPCMEDSDCPGNYLCIKPINQEFKSRNMRPIPGFVKFIYSEKGTIFCEISTVDLSYVGTVKSTVEISQNFVAFSEYMNFK